MQTAAALSGFNVLDTHDYDFARERVGQIFCPHRLTPGIEGGGDHILFNHAALGATSVNWVQYGREMQIEPVPFEKFYLLQIPVDGEAELVSNGRTFGVRKGSASMINPGDELAMKWSAGCRKLILRIDRSALERFAELWFECYLPAPLDFGNFLDWSSPQLAAARGLVDLIVSDLEAGAGILGHSEARRHFEDSLFAALLLGQDHSLSGRIGRRSPAVPRAVKRAEEYIAAHAREDISVADLVGASVVSARTLFESFRRFRGVTPMQYLRRYRLDRAREELESGGAGVSVTDVAMRWNFEQLGRFASYYASVYGERPSETLRRGRSAK